MTDKANQCAGCEVGMRVNQGIHIDKDGHRFMTCQRGRYITERWEEIADEWMNRIPIMGDRQR